MNRWVRSLALLGLAAATHTPAAWSTAIAAGDGPERAAACESERNPQPRLVVATPEQISAVLAGHLRTLQATRPDPNAVETETRRSLLMLAAANGQFQVAEYLIQQGARVEEKDCKGRTALLWASDTRLLFPETGKASNPGYRKVIRLLLKHGADANARSNHGTSALMLAAQQGHTEILPLLLEHGAQVDGASSFGWTALMFAANGGHRSATALLVRSGADLERRDRDGLTALMLAVLERHEDTLQVLLEAGADVDAPSHTGITPLMVTAVLGDENIAATLLRHDADPSRKNHDGKTALEIARETGHSGVARLLAASSR